MNKDELCAPATREETLRTIKKLCSLAERLEGHIEEMRSEYTKAGQEEWIVDQYRIAIVEAETHYETTAKQIGLLVLRGMKLQ